MQNQIKYFTLILLLVSNCLHAQRSLTGTKRYDARPGVGFGDRYTAVDWTLDYRLEIKDKALWIHFSNPTVTVNSQAKYFSNEASYTKQDLGIVVWPEFRQRPANFGLTVDVDCGGKKFLAGMDYPGNMSSRVAWMNQLPANLSLASVKVTEREWNYNGGPDMELEKIITAQKNKNASAGRSKTSDQSGASQANSNPLDSNKGTSQSSNTLTEREKADAYFDKNVIQNTPTGTYSNTATTDKYLQNMQAATSIVNTVGAYMEQERMAREQRQAEERERKTQIARSRDEEFALRKKEAEAYFQREFLDKHLSKAIQGNEESRLILYNAKKELIAEYWGKQGISSSTYEIINFERQLNQNITIGWLEEMAAKDNLYAMLELAKIYYGKKEGASSDEEKNKFALKRVEYLSKAAHLGNVEAMMGASDTYDFGFVPGAPNLPDNPVEKCVYFLELAAKSGCQDAMIDLGHAYLKSYKGLNKDKSRDQYKIGLDWLLKGVNPETPKLKDYACTTSPTSLAYAYRDLADFYQKGLGTEKNAALAKEYNKKSKEILNYKGSAEASPVYQEYLGIKEKPLNNAQLSHTVDSVMKSFSAVSFSEDFSFNKNNWLVQETDQYKFGFVDGKYRVQSKKGGSWFATIPTTIFLTNFEISVSITKVEGTDDYYFGTVLGFEPQSRFHHFMGVTGRGDFVFANKGPAPRDIIPTKMNGAVIRGNATNNLKLVKSNNQFKLYINDELMGEAPAEFFLGTHYGFQIWSGSGSLTVDFDNLVIRGN